MPAVLVTGGTVTQNSPFSSLAVTVTIANLLLLIVPTYEGMARLSLTWSYKLTFIWQFVGISARRKLVNDRHWFCDFVCCWYSSTYESIDTEQRAACWRDRNNLAFFAWMLTKTIKSVRGMGLAAATASDSASGATPSCSYLTPIFWLAGGIIRWLAGSVE